MPATKSKTVNEWCRCAKRILNGSIPLTRKNKEKLRPFKQKLRDLANKKVSQSKKKKIIQNGGFFSGFYRSLKRKNREQAEKWKQQRMLHQK